jgi:hypothetical protein
MGFYRTQPSLAMVEEAMTENFDAKKMAPQTMGTSLKT